MASYDFGVAVVGAGFIGPVHVEALRRLGLEVRGILGRDREESESARERLSLPRAYRDFQEVLEDRTAASVHLAVPNVLHFELTRMALEAGKHVLCEKPLAMNSRESSELVALADARKLGAAVCYNIRFYPLNLEVRERIARGDLGRILAVNGSYTQDWLLFDTDYNWRVLAEQGGELRAVADIGTHWMDLVCAITGLEIESVCADLATVHPVRYRPRGEVETFTGKCEPSEALEPVRITTEDYGNVLLHFRGTTRGAFGVSQVSAGRKNCLRYEIIGSDASVAWNSESPNELWIGCRSEPNRLLVRDPSLLADAAARFTSYPGGHNEGFPDTFKQCFKAFYDYLAEGDFSREPTFPTFAEGHREVALCEAILQSHRTQSWVKL